MLCLIGTAFVSCVGTAPTKEVHLIDSLNQAAYAYRYKIWTHRVMRLQRLTGE